MRERLRLIGPYGAGSQNDFDDMVFQHSGCGVIALADLFFYLEQREKWREAGERSHPDFFRQSGVQYRSELEKLWHSFPLRRFELGVDGLSLARSFNRRARALGSPFRARWGSFCTAEALRRAIYSMLQRDIPVILSVGPGFALEGRRGLPLRRHGASAGEARDHYMTVVGLSRRAEGDVLLLASWGELYEAEFSAYIAGRAHPPVFGTLLSSVLIID